MRWKSDSYRKRVVKGVHKLLYGWSDTSSSEEEQQEERNKEDNSIKPQYESNLYDDERQDEYQLDGWIQKSESEDDYSDGAGDHSDSDAVNPDNILPASSNQERSQPQRRVSSRRYINVSQQAHAYLDDEASNEEAFEDDSSGDGDTFGGSTSPSKVASIDTNDEISTLKDKVNRKKRKAESEEDYNPSEDDESESEDDTNDDISDGRQITLEQSFAFSVLKDK